MLTYNHHVYVYSFIGNASVLRTAYRHTRAHIQASRRTDKWIDGWLLTWKIKNWIELILQIMCVNIKLISETKKIKNLYRLDDRLFFMNRKQFNVLCVFVDYDKQMIIAWLLCAQGKWFYFRLDGNENNKNIMKMCAQVLMGTMYCVYRKQKTLRKRTRPFIRLRQLNFLAMSISPKS